MMLKFVQLIGVFKNVNDVRTICEDYKTIIVYCEIFGVNISKC